MEKLQELMKLINRKGEVFYVRDEVYSALGIKSVMELYGINTFKILSVNAGYQTLYVISEETAKELIERQEKDLNQWEYDPITQVYTNIHTKNSEYGAATISYDKAAENYKLYYEYDLGKVSRTLYVHDYQAIIAKANCILRQENIIV